ncbi:tubulin binding cofactor A [Chytridium lagenaria]|nr:tubulin binding cofactor A [Chytridium lagenaria]
MLAQNTTVRDLKIKTGVAKRIGKELKSYRSEFQKQQERIDELIKKDTDEHTVRKQREVLEETNQMLPDTHRRLVAAVQELEAVVAEFLSGESEEITEAKDIIQTSTALLA